jgi:hypothetical protein
VWNVWEAIRSLEARLLALQCENEALRRELEAQKKRTLRIKKVVYHVHSLHIDEMSGTLNIGINAPLSEEDMEQIELEMQKTKD